MSNIILPSREYVQPVQSACRKGCPARLTPTYCVTAVPTQGRAPLIQKFTTMTLVHKTKENEVKNELPLNKIHQELETDSLFLKGSGASNILLSKMSFNCLITTASGIGS